MTEAKLEVWLEETRSFAPSPEFSKQANAQPSIYEEAAPDPAAWWRREAIHLTWHNEPTKTLEWDLPFAKRFSDGTINASVNCVARNLESGNSHDLTGRGVADIWIASCVPRRNSTPRRALEQG